jgi:hypothetical protein
MKDLKGKPIELTLDQHLNNILFALQHGSLTISNAERNAIYSSYNHVHSLLIKKETFKEKVGKQVREKNKNK